MRIKKSPHGYLAKYGAEYKVKSRLYGIWSDMRKRCNTPGTTNYSRYGAKGVRVCAEWNGGYEAFLIWSLSNGYKSNLTIDRIDGKLGYFPENCRWVGYDVQGKNRSSVNIYTFDGFSGSVTDWALKIGMKRKTLQERIKAYKWPIEKALTTPTRARS